jgi:hypothetical protein
MMPAPKRAASDSFSSSQQLVVKRQKSDANLSNGSAVAVVGNNVQNGALVQTVWSFLSIKSAASPAELRDEGRLMEELVRSREPVGCKPRLWSSLVFRLLSSISAFLMISRALWRSICNEIRPHRPTHSIRINGPLHLSVHRFIRSTELTMSSTLAHLRTM